MDIGFIGLGAMGRGMAANLVKAGHAVRAWNRSAVHGLEGVAVAASPGDAFQADAAFTMLSDDPAIREVVLDSGALASARRGLVHVVTATVSVAFADELAAAHQRAGVGYVSAPVFGRPDVAAAGQLNILAAGETGAIEAVRPLLDAIGRKVWVMGAEPRQANAAKIAGNMMIAMAIEAMAEATALTESNGVPRQAFLELMLGTLFGGRAYETYGAKIRDADYEPGFRMRLGLKDLRLAGEAAAEAGRRLPMLDAVRARMGDAVEAGMGERDWSGMADYTISRADAAG